MSNNNDNGNGKQIQRREGQALTFKQQVHNFRELLTSQKEQIAMAVPKHVSPDRLIRVALTTLSQTPALLKCSQFSVVRSLLQAAALGLEPDGVLGHAYLVPFKSECQLIIGYKGLLKLARQSGMVSTIQAHEVRDGDEFSFRYGTENYLKHKPAEPPLVNVTDEKTGEVSKEPDPDWKPGAITHFYAVAKLADGSNQFDVMQTWEVNRIRDKSQGYQYAKRYNKPTPWVDYYPEMGKKTVARRLCKTIPSSTDKDNLQRAIAIDEAGDAGVSQDSAVIDVTALDGFKDDDNQLAALTAKAEAEADAAFADLDGKEDDADKAAVDAAKADPAQAELPVDDPRSRK